MSTASGSRKAHNLLESTRVRGEDDTFLRDLGGLIYSLQDVLQASVQYDESIESKGTKDKEQCHKCHCEEVKE